MIQVGDTVKLLAGFAGTTSSGTSFTFASGFKGKVVSEVVWADADKWWIDFGKGTYSPHSVPDRILDKV